MCGVICVVVIDIISVWLNEVLNLLINELIRNNYKDKGLFLLIYLNKKKLKNMFLIYKFVVKFY